MRCIHYFANEACRIMCGSQTFSYVFSNFYIKVCVEHPFNNVYHNTIFNTKRISNKFKIYIWLWRDRSTSHLTVTSHFCDFSLWVMWRERPRLIEALLYIVTKIEYQWPSAHHIHVVAKWWYIARPTVLRWYQSGNESSVIHCEWWWKYAIRTSLCCFVMVRYVVPDWFMGCISPHASMCSRALGSWTSIL